MAKSHDVKKDTKKQPSKTLKEKREAKKKRKLRSLTSSFAFSAASVTIFVPGNGPYPPGTLKSQMVSSFLRNLFRFRMSHYGNTRVPIAGLACPGLNEKFVALSGHVCRKAELFGYESGKAKGHILLAVDNEDFGPTLKRREPVEKPFPIGMS